MLNPQRDRNLVSCSWQNAVDSVRERLGEDALAIFLTQLSDVSYSNWMIADLWGFSAYIVNVWRKAICLNTLALPPELGRYLLQSPVQLIYSKDKPCEKSVA
jgi:hypothetical protein